MVVSNQFIHSALAMLFFDQQRDLSSDEMFVDNIQKRSRTLQAEETTRVSDAPNRRQVKFSEVHVRTHTVEYGFPTDISYPLTLGWKIFREEVFSVDRYQSKEEPKVAVEQARRGRSTSGRPLTLQPDERRERLRCMGYTESQINKLEYRREVQCSMTDISNGYLDCESKTQSSVKIMGKLLW